MFPASLDSPRLRFEALVPAHLHDLHAVCSSPAIADVTRHLSWNPHRSLDETRAFIGERHARHEAGEEAHYLLRPRGDEPHAGTVVGGASLDIDWDRRLGQLGVWLRPRVWGRGYSGERAAALLALAFDDLALQAVTAIVAEGNENSRRAVERYVERFGGRYDGVLRNWGTSGGREPYDFHRYSIRREEYVAATR
jgi:ribosomal-protein-alanine N-acetyltransferase